jgi:hypothetical protein
MFHTYVLQQYFPNVSVVQYYVALSVFMLQVASALSRCCICFTHLFQVYVSDVSSISYVCCIQVFYVARVLCNFIHMLHSSVLCCIHVFYVARVSCCSKSHGTRGVMVAQHRRQGMGHDELGAGGRDVRPLVSYGRVRSGQRSVHDRGRVRVRGSANGLESIWIGRAARARRIVHMHGHCDEVGCTCGAEKNPRRGQNVQASRRPGSTQLKPWSGCESGT